jgi:hypothetical protein
MVCSYDNHIFRLYLCMQETKIATYHNTTYYISGIDTYGMFLPLERANTFLLWRNPTGHCI